MEQFPNARDLVLVGGGHSHVVFLRMLGMQPIPGLKVTLISPDVRTPYSGMLPGYVAGHYREDDVYIDLVPLCRFAGADFIRAEVTSLDLDLQSLNLHGRPSLHYDVLSLDIGSTPVLAKNVSEQDVIPVKPISSFLVRWQSFLRRVAEGAVSKVGFVGAGAGGVELCLAVQFQLQQHFADRSFQIHLFTDGKTVLQEYDAGVRVRFEKLLATKNIQVHRDFRAAAVKDSLLCSEDGRDVQLDEIFWITQAGAQHWPGSAGLEVDTAGFVCVHDTLQSLSHRNVFAVGDCATMVKYPRPKAGVYAVRQGRPLYRNIRAYVLGNRVRGFRPQSRFLSLISMGAREAVASRNGLSVQGAWVWQWKNWIDQRFMQRFADLPDMLIKPINALQAEFGDQMHCGGCGSKVAADLLSEVLGELLGAAAPRDDAVLVQVPSGKSLIQSVDHFRSFLNDPYLQARIAVCHAVSDIYACGGEPLSVLASLTLPFGKPGPTRSLLQQLLSGTVDQLDLEGATLIGGHTSEGMELSLGYTVNGVVDEGQGWRKDVGMPGHVLVLTKPLGTGVIFAADMQHRAKGAWVNAALEQMCQSNGLAARIARGFAVDACTDITGFGLAGHCLEMIGGAGSTGPGIELLLSQVPTIPGATQCLAQGITSSLHDANRQVTAGTDVTGSADILFDPQTSGGLLFSVPVAQGESLVAQLQQNGYRRAAIVGRVVAQPGLRIL